MTAPEHATLSGSPSEDPAPDTGTDTALMNTYARTDLELVRGEGVYLWDAQGRRYLDFYAGIGVNALGHGHPVLLSALRRQIEKPWHVTNLHRIPDGERLARRLTAHSFADVAFFCNSGVEALEAAIKLARRHHHAGGHPEKWRIITFQGGFHGRSLATIAAAGNPKYLDGFGPPVDGFDNVPFGNMNALRTAIGEETAAILIEPVQGEGGIRPVSDHDLQAIRAAADEFGLLLILDEVQCGNGRTGHMWAHERAGVMPDVLATAKGIGGGFPLGAVLATTDAARGMVPGMHGTTFGGNPLAMAAGNAVLDVLEGDGFLDRVRQTGDLLGEQLSALVAAHPQIYTQSRGIGLMRGLVCNGDGGVTCGDMVARLQDAGLLCVAAGENVIRLLPPLIVTPDHVREAVEFLGRVAEHRLRDG